MSGLLAAAMIANTAMSLYGQKKEAEAEQDSLRQKARLQSMQADELLSRMEINLGQMEREGKSAVSSFNVSMGNIEGASVSINRAQMVEDMNQQMQFERRVSEFDASMLRIGADNTMAQAQSARKAAFYSQAGTAIGGAVSAANAYKK